MGSETQGEDKNVFLGAAARVRIGLQMREEKKKYQDTEAGQWEFRAAMT